MARPPHAPTAAYLDAEQTWLAHRRTCWPCRDARTGLPQCRPGAAIWTAMNQALAALEADTYDLTLCDAF